MTCKDCIHNGLCYKENDYDNFPNKCGDFVPSRPHGKWEKPFEMNGKTYHKCTNCHISSELILIDKYCPECGAKMDGKEAEDETN